MEETLRELQEAMAAHRRALAESSARQQVPSSAVKRDVAAIDERQAVLQRLAADIERVSGIEITGMMEAKLGRVLASVNLAALDAWVSQLYLLPPDHPEW